MVLRRDNTLGRLSVGIQNSASPTARLKMHKERAAYTHTRTRAGYLKKLGGIRKNWKRE